MLKDLKTLRISLVKLLHLTDDYYTFKYDDTNVESIVHHTEMLDSVTALRTQLNIIMRLIDNDNPDTDKISKILNNIDKYNKQIKTKTFNFFGLR